MSKDLEARIGKLEKEAKIYRSLLVVLLALFLMGSAKNEQELSLKKLTISDKITLRNGDKSIILSVGKTKPSIAMENNEISAVNLVATDKGGVVLVRNAKNKPVAHIAATEDGQGEVQAIRSEKGKVY